MAKYSSKPVTIDAPVDEVFAKISNISAFQERLDMVPPEERAKIGDVRFTDDSIIINAAPVGEMKFNVVERTAPSRIVLSAEQSPVPLLLSMNLAPAGDNATDVVSDIDVEIPAMLKPLIGGKMQEAADKFGELLTTFFKH